MKKTSTLIFILISVFTSYGQNTLDNELSKLADMLAQKVEKEMVVENIAIADFVDMNDEPSNLGKYLAEEFSYTLVEKSNQRGSKFKIIDRTQLRRLMKEAGKGEKGMIDPASIQKMGRLEGISAIVYGKLVPVGNHIRVFAKVVILEQQVNQITVRGKISRTPTIESFLNPDYKEVTSNYKSQNESNNSSLTFKGETTSFTHKHIQVSVLQCTRQGTSVVCTIQVTSISKDDNFSIRKNETKLIGANRKKYSCSKMVIGRKSSGVQVNHFLKSNSPQTILLKFSNIPSSVNSLPLLEVDCKSSSAFSFVAQLQNINIQP